MPQHPQEAAASVVAKGARRCREWLRAKGQLVVGTGCLQAGATALALHTDFGPAGQDKETNQDYALAWSSGAEPLLTLALADGVTSSHRAEWAAELACAVALKALAGNLLQAVSPGAQRPPPGAQAVQAFAVAEGAIKKVSKRLAVNPEESCPRGQYRSTWRYILRKGALLQTTLMLAWVQNETIHVAMVGDGGLTLRSNIGGPGTEPRDKVLAEADLNTDEVHALGPCSPQPQTLDLWLAEPWDGARICALYTDGLGRGMQKADISLLNWVAELRAQGRENPAEQIIREVVRNGHPAFDDNLTLAILSKD